MHRTLWTALWILGGCATGQATITHEKSGATTALDELRGHVVVVSFWAEWCKPCLKEIPEIARVVDEEGNGALFLPVYYRAQPTRESNLYGWIAQQPAYFSDRVCWGSSAFLAHYDLHSIPKTYVLGRDGALVKEFHGSITGERTEQLRQALRQGLAVQPAVPPAAPAPR
jgi:thiol-disulfide isomerase/thioredoxin